MLEVRSSEQGRAAWNYTMPLNYRSIEAGGTTPTDAFAGFGAGHRSALLVDAVLESAQRGEWTTVRRMEQ